ncbi:MAG: epoxyqueuosine reductase QueH [Nitrospirota bacterium]
MEIFLHICCANCSLYPIKVLREEGHDITGFWYNPNIHPYQEYKMRLVAVKEMAEKFTLKMIYRDSYDLELFLRKVVYREDVRCGVCYGIRLKTVAQEALNRGFRTFTSTLLYSKYQDFNGIIEIGETISKGYGLDFYKRDFRIGWEDGRKVSREMGFYRQKYCGCIYSEKERYLNEKGSRGQGVKDSSKNTRTLESLNPRTQNNDLKCSCSNP